MKPVTEFREMKFLDDSEENFSAMGNLGGGGGGGERG